jgi:adenylate cyclase
VDHEAGRFSRMIGTNPLFPSYVGYDLTQYAVVALMALGMALAFIAADRESPTSRALALGFACVGLAVYLGIVVGVAYPVPAWLIGWFGLADSGAMIAFLEWIWLVRRTIPAGALDTRTGDYAIRAGQLAGIVYAVACVLLPQARIEDFLGALADPQAVHRSGFWVFMGPIAFGCFCAVASLLLLLNRRPDRAERVRVVAMIASLPLLALSLIVGLEYSAIVMALGLVVILIGAVEYSVLQGQRGQFMSRFLSPQVAEMVRRQGLKQAMQENLLEISVICCDLRGFTPYAQAHPSSQVLRVLREYYDAVGEVVARHGATIKDFAGDGVLILVGAPLAQADHARVGVAMAQQLRTAVRAVVQRASSPSHRLGIGVGVASGPVTVGIIGSSGRYEYTAVGPAVNLAARLCELAADGEVLLAAETMQHCGDCRENPSLEPRRPVAVKGYAEPVALFNLRDAALAGAA